MNDDLSKVFHMLNIPNKGETLRKTLDKRITDQTLVGLSFQLHFEDPRHIGTVLLPDNVNIWQVNSKTVTQLAIVQLTKLLSQRDIINQLPRMIYELNS